MEGRGGDLAKILSDAIGVPLARARSLLESKSTRVMRYRGIRYITLRRDLAGHYEGTAILIDEATGEYRVVEGYPHIKRVLLLSKAVPQHFIDEVIVEEKMDGHNVRVIMFKGMILALTRGGYICPYTTHKLNHKYRRQVESLLDDLGHDAVIAGEVVGMENPYTRYHYPEAPHWDYFVFDIFKDGIPLPVASRRELVDKHGLRNVPVHGRYRKEDWQSILETARSLEDLGREGIILKDPLYRVEPLKYTTSYINVRDIKEGMLYPFDEGHTFIFPRVLRQMFKAIEEEWSEDELKRQAALLGEAILLPAVEGIRRFMAEGKLAEEFTLTFHSLEALEEFLSYSASLGVPLTIISMNRGDGIIKVRVQKPKRTPDYYKRILRTGLSPLD
ncbi:MAG: RNA ligase [Desulfurococcales archaeon]|nr:RNA ligase [Desulfurococcales archaeon]